MENKKILVVDDDPEAREHFLRILKNAGYHTDANSSGKEAIETIQLKSYDVMLLDLMMPEISGIDVLIELNRRKIKTKVIMITAFATVGTAVEAIKRGASDYISKPFQVEELLSIIGRTLEETKFEEKARKLDLDELLLQLSSPIRREVITFLFSNPKARFKDIFGKTGLNDHSKLLFHLRVLKEAGIVEQDRDKLYILTDKGENVADNLKNIETHL